MKTVRIGTLLLSCAAGTVLAGEGVDALVRKAEAVAKEGDRAAAARVYSSAVALAHENGDLLAEQRVSSSLRRTLRGGREELSALLLKLDPKRSGAFVSAHLIAQRLLCLSTVDGEMKAVKQAAKVIAIHSRGGKKIGKCAAAMRDYAAGMTAIADGKDLPAAGALERALRVVTREGWPDLAMHVGTELAAVQLRLDRPELAAKALESVGSTIPASTDPVLPRIWRNLVAKRLEDAPKEVLAPFERAMAPFSGGMSVSAAGGRGADGRAGSAGLSGVGDALESYPRKKALVTVRRTKKGFQIREGFGPKFRKTQAYGPGVRHYGHEGVTYSFWGHAVALTMVDPTGRSGQPGGSSHRGPLRAFYHLGEGETWGVTRQGIVTVAGR